MSNDTENAIDTLFNKILDRIQQAIETNQKGSGFTHESVALLYYYFQKIDIKRGESYVMSPDWIVSKKATINPKNEKYNECLKWTIIAGLNYNKIKEKELKKVKKFKRVDTDFSSPKKQHYLAVTRLSALLAKKSLDHDGDLYCLNCFNS